MSHHLKVAKLSEVPPGSSKRVEVDGEPVALFNLGGEIFALSDTCTHEEASLSEGEIVGEDIECPLHGACFSIRTGEAMTPPAVEDARHYRVRVSGDHIEIETGG